jgi:hypothetical protein
MGLMTAEEEEADRSRESPAGVDSLVELGSQQRCGGPVVTKLWVTTREWGRGLRLNGVTTID